MLKHDSGIIRRGVGTDRAERTLRPGTSAPETPTEKLRLRRAHRAPLLEALAAEYRPSLCRTERYGGFLAALRAVGLGLCPHLHAASATTAARTFRALGFAAFASLRLVLESFVREKHLLPGRKYKLSAGINTFKQMIGDLKEGVYVVKITDLSSGEISVKRLVKQ